MKILKLQYILILAVLPACQDENFQVPMEENEVHIATENEILLKRGYSDYTLTAERLAGLEGCRIRAQEGFVFLSDSIVRSGKPLTIEVEQNPYQEERLGRLDFTDREGTIVRSFSLRQASSLTQTTGEAYSGALIRSYGVGYGYDAFGEYASYNSVRDQVISLPALRLYERENKTSCIVDDLAPDMATTILEGNDSQQLLKSLSAHAGLGLDVGFFQAHVKVSYAHSDLKTNAYSFCTIMNNYKALSRHTDPYNLVEIARNNPKILTEGFRNCVNKISDAIEKDRLDKAIEYTDELFRIYGTHIIYHADLGGKLEFCSTFERAFGDAGDFADGWEKRVTGACADVDCDDPVVPGEFYGDLPRDGASGRARGTGKGSEESGEIGLGTRHIRCASVLSELLAAGAWPFMDDLCRVPVLLGPVHRHG